MLREADRERCVRLAMALRTAGVEIDDDLANDVEYCLGPVGADGGEGGAMHTRAACVRVSVSSAGV